MKHYVLTRSAYGPAWSLAANRRRLELTRAVTARLMAAQTNRDWTWLVLVDPRDPLLAERIEVFRSGGEVVPLSWQPKQPTGAPWDRHRAAASLVQRIAASAYRAPWASVMERDGMTLQTRIDDDDGFIPDALARVARAAGRLSARTVLMQPVGFRVWAGRYSGVRHTTNAMHTLVTPPGDDLCVYDYGHRLVERVAPIVTVDRAPAWLWVRHRDTISGYRAAEHPITSALRALFPIDWAAL